MSFDRVVPRKLMFALLAFALPVFPQQPAQQGAQQPTQPGAQQPVQPAPPAQTAPSTAQQNVASQPGPAPQEPAVLEDGGFSIEPIYWLNRAQPALFGGAQATAYGSLPYPGNSNPAFGAELAIPTGHSNTLRFSYFRILGHANQTATQSTTVYSEAYSPGDYLVASYNIQTAKLSWDYLSYTWHREPGNIHFKTLYEVQYTNISTNIFAPFLPASADTSGNNNYATGSQSVILPTLGVEFEQAIHHGFRWEVKGSGFAIPHHSDIWDAQADIALRIRRFELIAGEKAYHFKTSPQAAQYFADTLDGVFVALRYYLGTPRQ